MTASASHPPEGASSGGQVQPALPGLARRTRKVRDTTPADSAPVASVVVDVPVAHLDHEFDYLIPRDMDEAAQVGARVSVRLAGRDVPGFIVGRSQSSTHPGALRPVRRVVSAVPVLTPTIWELCGRVAAYYAGTRMDVVRLAIPPRHARAETAYLAGLPGCDSVGTGSGEAAGTAPAQPGQCAGAGDWETYPGGLAFLERLRAGQAPRAAWCPLPGGSPGQFDPAAPGFAHSLAIAAKAVVDSGRRVLIVVPTGHQVAQVLTALETHHVGPVARLLADDGPAARYREYLSVLVGQAMVTVGTRAAAFAPVPDLGLAVLWDEANDLHREPRAPYPHAGHVLAMRATQEGCGLLLAGWARSVQTQRLVESGWLREVTAPRDQARRRAAPVRQPEPRDALHGMARIPSSAFHAVKACLEGGPVLVQVPRAGYVPALACAACRTPARCAHCSGPLCFSGAATTPRCAWCGRDATGSTCPSCGASTLRSTRVGASRTAEELGRAFPGIVVRQSGGQRVLNSVPATPALVVATPGAEPGVEGGYQAALLLDAGVMTSSVRLSAGQDALARWLAAAALVRPSGQVWLLGGGAPGPAGALVRRDPVGFAARELAERAELRLPPAAATVKVTGESAAVARLIERVSLPPGGEVVGPFEQPSPAVAAQPSATAELSDGVGTLVGEPEMRTVTALLRAPVAAHLELTRQVRQALAVRSGRREPGTLRVVVDPADVL